MIKNMFIFILMVLSFSLVHQVSADISAPKVKKRVKTQRNVSQNRIPSHIKKKALARRNLIRNYKRLSAKQKLHLITSMVRTMAALELAHARRQGLAYYDNRNSLFNPFWSLFIMRAYADATSGNTCFLGGHFVPNLPDGRCNWRAARNIRRCTLGDDQKGVQCNSDLFPSSPCVPDLTKQQRRDKGIPFYSTTQACAYADAHNIKRHIENESGNLTSIQTNEYFAAGQLINNSDFWSQDPNDWVRQRNRILDDHLDEYASLLASHNEGKVITQLQEIKDRCSRASGFEAKHCEVFKEDLTLLESAAPLGDSTDPEQQADQECFDFHKLPGEHFCQVRVATTDANKDHLIVRLEGTINGDGFAISPPNREAVIYRLDNEKKKYCKDSNFVGQKRYFGNTSNINSRNDICRAYSSHISVFSYLGVNLHIQKGSRNNICQFDPIDNVPDGHYVQHLNNSDKLSHFLPGVRVQCAQNVSIDDGIANGDSFTHTNCGTFKRELNGLTNTSKCLDPDVAALRNAASFLKHHAVCRGQPVTVRIKKSNGEYQLLNDWLKNHQSFDEGEYKIQIQRKRPGSSSYLRADYYTFNSRLGKTTGAITQFPYGRRDRIISDWLYGDGKSINDAGEGGGLNGIVSKLCHRPEQNINRARGSTKNSRGI